MKKSLSSLLVGALLAVATGVNASDDIATKIATKVADSLNVTVNKVVPSPVNDIYQVYSDKGVFYVTADGSKMFHGNLYDLDNGLTNLTDQAMSEVRRQELAATAGTTIDYPAQDEKYVVNVFTDISCGYCRKLHNEMAEYNALGITVRYLAYPRNGRNAPAWQQMEQVWCAADPQDALDNAKANIKMSGTSNCDAAQNVAMHHSLGGSFGLSGTPAIVLEDGTMLGGYLPPAKLLDVLEK
ncbi:bifunctional protein-disulfide isomerase/oxidoreductase DsbC [Ferrimonas lipolytica]|uniref:Thiol:disulfide interchange protein n=1 Tax=Ferrimonas lipolytica TaxID=2724191 RepID=A0A6H1UEE0_9GAMM|nr:bifunctional protein-disulfide isomerase/oxidoreductase DsbC [Ferrimonas lipolytica]QIZ77451.1 bifunctional protein-disulfide isomerase/oxidoreductase DsbC [Ferrimonas lipolytica]